MSEFELRKRSPFIKENFYNENHEYYSESSINNFLYKKVPERLKNNIQEVENFYKRWSWREVSNYQEYVQLQYSASINMNEVVAETKSMLSRFEKHFSQDFPKAKLYLWEADSYIYILWLLSLAVLSDSKDYLQIIPTWIGSEDDNTDLPLVDKPMKAFLDLVGYQGQVQVTEKAFFSKSVYPLISEIIDAETYKKGELLKQYLKGWYKSNKNTYWYNYHKETEIYFFGYWSFESAVLALLLDINVGMEEIDTISVFPKDYFYWAKLQK
ncbi:PoNe immunity protein domain-containing protein [Actinobacillus porcinus]|uniref:PoNe immunity protein domain-containing protein n=1 Tax=Actinobacillus porcinus TaxID=51048 RepID=UPI0023537F0E|nr:PoNe immunity protein domain-containing protein [Actinobacillus porcinus]